MTDASWKSAEEVLASTSGSAVKLFPTNYTNCGYRLSYEYIIHSFIHLFIYSLKLY